MEKTMTSDFERIEIDPVTAEAHYERPDFAKVVFHNIAETYPTEVDVECQYTITSSLIPTPRDWVGLYRVGWSSSKEYLYFLWSPVPPTSEQGKDIHNSVTFHAGNLPRDDGEFYQFCYVSSTGHVRGASTPFQFKQPCADDFVEIEDEENDMMVIKSKTLALEENLGQALEEKSQLEKKIELLEQERDSLLGKLVESTKELTSRKTQQEQLTQELQKTQDQVQCQMTEKKDITLAHDSLKEKVNTLNQEKAAILKRLDENDKYISSLQDKIKSLINEKDELTGRNKSLEEEKELFKTHFTKSENNIQGYLLKIDNLKHDLNTQKEVSSKQGAEMSQMKSELESEKKRLQQQLSISKADKNYIEDLTEKLRNCEDKLEAAELCKTLLNEEVSAVQQAHQKMSADLEKATSESYSLKHQMTELETRHMKEQDLWKGEIDKLKTAIDAKEQEVSDLSTKVSELEEQLKVIQDKQQADKDGSLFALQKAQAHLKERYAHMKKQNAELSKQLDELLFKEKSWHQTEQDLRREAEDLKERLTMGADEYKLKFLECRKLQHELKKLQKQGRRSSERKSSESSGTDWEKLQKSEVESTTKTSDKEDSSEAEAQTEDGIADLTSSELQAQLDDLGRELQQRHSKKQKYKQLYQEEKDKNSVLQKHYYEELTKRGEELKAKEEEVRRLKGRLQETEIQARKHAQKQQSKIDQQRRELEEFRGEKIDSEDDLSLEAVSAAIAEMDPLAAAEASVNLDAPLMPLPAPIQPEVLPSAKVAAVKHLNSVSSSSTTSSTGDLEVDGLLVPEEPTAPPSDEQEDDVDEEIPPLVPCHHEEVPEADEENFHDADGEPQKLCPVCNTTFPADLPNYMFEEHLDSHYGATCPMCQHQFPVGFPQEQFEMHVNSHFTN